jgi:hypothetical protein
MIASARSNRCFRRRLFRSDCARGNQGDPGARFQVRTGKRKFGGAALHESALAIRKTALGPEHPDTATSLDNLASRSIAGPWIRSALPMSGANRPGPGRGRAEPLNPAGVQHGENGRSHPVIARAQPAPGTECSVRAGRALERPPATV